jgi:hypothetical protein
MEAALIVISDEIPDCLLQKKKMRIVEKNGRQL